MTVQSPMLPARWRVRTTRPETHDTVTLSLVPDREADRRPVPDPGQFHMLSAFGVDEVPISVSGIRWLDGEGSVPVIEHTVRAVGDATRALTELKPGDPVGVRGPFGSRWRDPLSHRGPVVVMAGGLGLAPVRPLVEALATRPAELGAVWLMVGARNPRELSFAEDLHHWGEATDLRVLVTVDTADRHWHGHIGVVTHLLDDIGFGAGLPAASTLAYVCGPEIMMRFSARALTAAGVPAARSAPRARARRGGRMP
jgi:NAD(P)H-flavin reductase